jgi:hypothetical protein
MNKEWKEKWVKALRSGRYQQGRNVLREGDRYCCLGVLCEAVNRPPPRWNMGFLHVATESEACLVFSQQSALAGMNDAGTSFSAIADYIEANL